MILTTSMVFDFPKYLSIICEIGDFTIHSLFQITDEDLEQNWSQYRFISDPSTNSWPLQKQPLNPTSCFLSNHLSIHKRPFYSTLKQLSFLKSLCLKALSDAFRKSRCTQATWSPLSTHSLGHPVNQSDKDLTRPVRQDLPLLDHSQ